MTASSLGRATALAALSAAAYYAGAHVGYAFMIPQGVANIWPAAGVMLGLLLLHARRDWPALLAGGFAGSVISDFHSGLPAGFAISASLANILESVVAAWFVRRRLGSHVRLDTAGSVLTLVVGAAIVCNAVTALAGAVTLHVWLDIPAGFAWLIWFVGDGLGMLIAAPVVLAAPQALTRLRHVRPARALEAALLFGVLAAGALVALGPRESWTFLRPYAIFPLLFWAAFRFGPGGAATGFLILAGTALWHSALGQARFVSEGEGPVAAAVQLYLYLSTASLWSLITAALFAERAAGAARLAESRERYRSVVETATDAIVTIDDAGCILFVNQAACRMFGYSTTDLEGADFASLIPERFRPAYRDALAQYAEARQPRLPWSSVVPSGLRRDGREFPIEVSFGERQRGNRLIFTGIIRDLTEQRALEAQYRHAQKMEAVGQLAGGIAHDFNNLLTGILGYASMLEERLPPGSQERTELAEIRRAADRAASLTRQLLAFSRRQILEPQPVDLGESVRAMEAMLRRLIPENITVVIDAEPGLRTVHADPGQIEQVILNLSVNARDAMPNGGVLTLEIRNVRVDGTLAARHAGLRHGDFVRLSVIDGGTGMSPETLARAFDPFFTTKPQGQGTGLGLSTVDGIVRQSGGHVTVESKVGRGTIVSVYLPAVDMPLRAAARPAAEPGQRGSETVLLAEDEPGVRSLARRILEQKGYRVLAAATPSEARALAAANDDAVDLLLTDVVMPEMNGRELADALLARIPGLRVLFMSGYADAAIVHDGTLEEGTPFIQKPFTPAALVERVRRELDRR